MDTKLQELQHHAMQRQARQRLDLLADMRAVKEARDSVLPQREIAEVLVTSQSKVHRLLKAIERRGDNLDPDPAELILRAFANDDTRGELLEQLKTYPYDYGEDAPYPHEGRLPGTWDQVVVAYAQKLISKDEFDEVRAAVGR